MSSKTPDLTLRVAQISAYSVDQVSGINKVIAVLASELAHAGVEFTLMSPGQNQKDLLTNASVQVRLKVGRNVELAIRTLATLFRRRATFGVIHAHQPHIQSVASLVAARVTGVPGIITFHVRVPESSFAERLKTSLFTRLCINLAQACVVVSPRIASAYGIADYRTIPNGVESTPSSPAAPNGSTGQGPVELVFVGRVTRTKGVFVLLEALAKAWRQLPQIRLISFGPIDDIETYERLKDRFGVRGIVDDRGFDGNWLRTLLGDEIFVLPSYYEGLPLALLEAMSIGLPAIATPVGGVPDVVLEKESGLLVPVGDANKLADAIVWMGQNRVAARRMGLTARRLVSSGFSSRRMAEAYLSLYRSLSRNRP